MVRSYLKKSSNPVGQTKPPVAGRIVSATEAPRHGARSASVRRPAQRATKRERAGKTQAGFHLVACVFTARFVSAPGRRCRPLSHAMSFCDRCGRWGSPPVRLRVSVSPWPNFFAISAPDAFSAGATSLPRAAAASRACTRTRGRRRGARRTSRCGGTAPPRRERPAGISTSARGRGRTGRRCR